MLMRLSVPAKTDEEKAKLAGHRLNSIPEPTYGGQLQDLSIQGHKAEGQIKIDYKEKAVKLAGGETVHLRVPGYSIVDLGYGPLAPGTMMSPRVAPPMIGLGLLEAVPEEQILANADSDDANQDGISGKPNQVWSRENNKVMLGRFGWKAGVPSINQQAAEAANGDIGLSTTMTRSASGDCTESEKDCLDAPNGNSPQYQDVELGDDLFKLVAFYSHNLAVPPRRDPADPKALKGKELFYSIGCARCHKPKFVTGEAPGEPHLSHQLIWPYTDPCCDMGEGSPIIAPTAGRRAAGGAHGTALGHQSNRGSTAIRCFCMTGARGPSPGYSLARRRGQASRDKFAKLSKPGAPDRSVSSL
jgi:CxxC motif-containing protein (DUF1111 family)